VKLGGRTVIDLTHPIHVAMPVSIGMPGPALRRIIDRDEGGVAMVEVLELMLHTGTHVDAPFHFVANSPTIDTLDPLALSGSAVVVDVAPTEEWRGVEAAEIEAWERFSGELIRPGDVVLLRSGHARFWVDLPEGSAYLTHPWPYLASSSVELLLERRIKLLGVECPDPDKVDQRDLRSSTFEVHRRLLEAGVPIIENLAHLAEIPVTRVEFLALCLPISGAAGSPVRALAMFGG
jgi:arylformamidase